MRYIPNYEAMFRNACEFTKIISNYNNRLYEYPDEEWKRRRFRKND